MNIEIVDNGTVIDHGGKKMVFENQAEAMLYIAFIFNGAGLYWEEFKAKFALVPTEKQYENRILDMIEEWKSEGA